MIGLDTNVLVRFIAQDDPKQSPKASRLMESLSADSPGFVGIVPIIELVWVLSACYALKKDDVCQVLETVLRTKEIVVEQAEIVWKALRLYKNQPADFADCLIEHLARHAGATYTVTFDVDASKYCGMRLIN
jgi:predicted nucleic-acid-binding protein